MECLDLGDADTCHVRDVKLVCSRAQHAQSHVIELPGGICYDVEDVEFSWTVVVLRLIGQKPFEKCCHKFPYDQILTLLHT